MAKKRADLAAGPERNVRRLEHKADRQPELSGRLEDSRQAVTVGKGHGRARLLRRSERSLVV